MIPLINASENPRIPAGKFLGLNRQDKGSDGEFLDVKNMGSSHYPCLAPRGKRKIVYTASEIGNLAQQQEDTEQNAHEIKAIFSPLGGRNFTDGFCGILDNSIYAGGVLAGMELDMDRAGYFKGNSVPKQIYGDIRVSSGMQFHVLSYFDEIDQRTQVLRLAQCVNKNLAGEREQYCVLENLRRGVYYAQGERYGEPYGEPREVAYISIHNSREDFYDVQSYELHIEDPENPQYIISIESKACKVTLANGKILEFPKGTFYALNKRPSSSAADYVIKTRYSFESEKKIFEKDNFIGAKIQMYETGGGFKITVNDTAGINFNSDSEKPVKCWVETGAQTKTVEGKYYFNVGDELEIENFTEDIESKFTAVGGRCISARVAETRESNASLTNGGSFYMRINAVRQDEKKEWAYPAAVYPMWIYRKIPKMRQMCVHQNRLWGVSNSGEYIYASALGDFGNFYKLDGVDDNSAYFEISTPGEFVGITSYRDMVLAFKRDSISIVYGNTLTNYSVEQTVDGIGCIDSQSVCAVGGVLYFLGGDGFYAFNGSGPERISEKLNCRYDKAYGFGDGYRYYASARRAADGVYELLCFDSRYGIWTKEDDLQIISAVYYQNRLYAATKDTVYEFDAEDGTEEFDWEATGVVLYEDTFQNKGINEIRIRAKIPQDGQVGVYTSVNGEEFTLQKEILPRLDQTGDPVLSVYRVPVRFQNAEFYQIKLAGRGECVIYDVERAVYAGGKEYRRV